MWRKEEDLLAVTEVLHISHGRHYLTYTDELINASCSTEYTAPSTRQTIQTSCLRGPVEASHGDTTADVVSSRDEAAPRPTMY